MVYKQHGEKSEASRFAPLGLYTLRMTMVWLKENGAVSENDIALFGRLCIEIRSLMRCSQPAQPSPFQ